MNPELSFRFKPATKDKIANFIGNRLKEIKGGYFGRERFLLMTAIYRLLPYLGFNYCRLAEWKFVLKNLPKTKLKILDIGSTSSLFIYEFVGRGHDTENSIKSFLKKITRGMITWMLMMIISFCWVRLFQVVPKLSRDT